MEDEDFFEANEFLFDYIFDNKVQSRVSARSSEIID